MRCCRKPLWHGPITWSLISLLGLLRLAIAGPTDSLGQAIVFASLCGLCFLGRLPFHNSVSPQNRKNRYTSAGREVTGPPTVDIDDQLISLVALLQEPLYLDATILATLASRAWNTDIGTDCDRETSFAVGTSPHFLLRLDDWLFAVHNVPEPYFKNPRQVAAGVSDWRVREAIESHRAWLSIDLIGRSSVQTDKAEGDTQTRQHAYQRIGTLLAEFLDSDCLAVCCPEAGLITQYHHALEDALRHNDPLSVLHAANRSPIWTGSRNDSRMQAAVAEARNRWPEFVAAFERRDSHQLFSVKAPIGDGLRSELLWIHVTAIEHGVVYGTLSTQPLTLESCNLNDRVRVRVDDLRDWMYTLSDQIRGGFTLEPLKQPRRNPSTGDA